MFHLKWCALVHPEWHFCLEILVGYSDYNTSYTVFAWPNRYAETEMSLPTWQQAKNRHSPIAT